jgi:hypothetical protein
MLQSWCINSNVNGNAHNFKLIYGLKLAVALPLVSRHFTLVFYLNHHFSLFTVTKSTSQLLHIHNYNLKVNLRVSGADQTVSGINDKIL